jgi:hypothetical protein
MVAVRFAAIFIMVGGSVLALFKDDQNNESGIGPPYTASESTQECRMSYTACFQGFGVAFSTALFSQLFQHSVSSLVRPFSGSTDKKAKVPVRLLSVWYFLSYSASPHPQIVRFSTILHWHLRPSEIVWSVLTNDIFSVCAVGGICSVLFRGSNITQRQH